MSYEEQLFAGLANKRNDYRKYLEATADPLERARLIGFIQGLSLAIDDADVLAKMHAPAREDVERKRDAIDDVARDIERAVQRMIKPEGAPCSPSSSGSSRSSSASSPPA